MPAKRRSTPSPPVFSREPVATFVKTDADGEPVERVAWSPSQAVALTFDGWHRSTPSPVSAAPADEAVSADEAPTRTSSPSA